MSMGSSRTVRVLKALREVWAWKEACYREVAHLPFREAVRKRIEDSDMARNLPLDLWRSPKRQTGCVRLTQNQE